MRPRWTFTLLWPLTVAAVFVVSLKDQGWRVQVIAGLAIYLGMVSLLVVLAASRARSSGRQLQLLPRRRTSRIPDAVTETLPKSVWVLRNQEPVRLEPILLDGPLLTPPNIAFAAVLAHPLATLIHAASGDKPDEHERADLLAAAHDMAEDLPGAVDEAELAEWLDQLTGGEVAHRFDRPHDLDLATLGSLLALSAAAASKLGLTRTRSTATTTPLRTPSSTGTSSQTQWAPRPSDET